jgi:hypothetical protein
MSAIFWVATIIMALLAISFAAVPLIRESRRLGFVGIAIAMPIFATGLYWLVGSPQAAGVDAATPRPRLASPWVPLPVWSTDWPSN